MEKKQKKFLNNWIKVVGAREHNLKNISVAIPKNKLTGISNVFFDTAPIIYYI